MDNFLTVTIGQECAKQLGDPKVDTRRKGALEVERKVQAFLKAGDLQSIHKLIDLLKTQFASSLNINERKGFLTTLTIISVTLGKEHIEEFAYLIVDHALEHVKDRDNSVRYLAAEVLYNVAKNARGLLLLKFAEIFRGICELIVDNDPKVKKAGTSLDESFKTIVTSSGKSLSIDLFVRTTRQCLSSTTKATVKQHILTWLKMLDSTHGTDLVEKGLLPDILGHIFEALSSTDVTIRTEADKLLDIYLRRVSGLDHAAVEANWQRLVPIVISACRSGHEDTVRTALRWLNALLQLRSSHTVGFVSEMLGAVLQCIADANPAILELAHRANDTLAAVFLSSQAGGAPGSDAPPAANDGASAEEVLPAVFDVLQQSLKGAVPTKIKALEWVRLVFDAHPGLVQAKFEELLPELLLLLGDDNNVVQKALEVLARMTEDDPAAFNQFLEAMLSTLQQDNYKLTQHVGFIVKTLAGITPPDQLYTSLALILPTVEDKVFVSALVVSLNIILLTSPNLHDVRQALKRGVDDPAGRALFENLYRCWAYNAVSLLSLCLLSQAYEHAYRLVCEIGNMEITVAVLVQVDKLIQLLESPVFTFVRLALLEPEQNPYLIKTLFGVLMLLPQSESFEALHKRLKSVNTMCNLNYRVEKRGGKEKASTAVDWGQLLAHYKSIEEEKKTWERTGRS